MTVAEIQDIVRENALPNWVEDALTENQATGAAAARDDGEVVTSRERPLVHSGSGDADDDGVPACQATSSHHGAPSGRRPAGQRGADSAGTSARSQGSLGSGLDVDDDLKEVLKRAVNGMKAREAARLKQHLQAMQDRWKAAAEANVAELQDVIHQYQVPRCCFLWLDAHVPCCGAF